MAFDPKNYKGYNLESIGSELEMRKKRQALLPKLNQWVADGRPKEIQNYLSNKDLKDAFGWGYNDINMSHSPNPAMWGKIVENNFRSQMEQSDLMVRTYEEAFAPAAPVVDTRLADLQKAQQESAKRFRDSIPLYAKELMSSKEQGARHELAAKMEDADKNLNRRGLLYGGQRLKARAGAKQETAQGLSQERANVNSDLTGIADTMSQQALNTGMDNTQLGQDMFSVKQDIDRDALDRLMKNQSRVSSAYGDAFGAIGQVAGKVAAKA